MPVLNAIIASQERQAADARKRVAPLCEHPNGRCDSTATTACVACGTPLCAKHAYYRKHGPHCASCPDDNEEG